MMSKTFEAGWHSQHTKCLLQVEVTLITPLLHSHCNSSHPHDTLITLSPHPHHILTAPSSQPLPPEVRTGGSRLRSQCVLRSQQIAFPVRTAFTADCAFPVSRLRSQCVLRSQQIAFAVQFRFAHTPSLSIVFIHTLHSHLKVAP